MFKRVIALGVLSLVLAFTVPNTRALYEGVFFYWRDVLTYDVHAIVSINPAGRYASLYDLVSLNNTERLEYLQRWLNARALNVTAIPIPNSAQRNLFVPFDSSAPYIVFAAHYDKLYDDAAYQGASDNTAAVSVFLAALDELVRRNEAGARAFLFTGEEETGLRGAQAFVTYARAHALPIRTIIVFDNLGRGELAVRPSAEQVGWVFTLPLVGDFAFDSRAFHASSPYAPVNPRVVCEFKRAYPSLVVYERFTARGDSNAFLAEGLDSVLVSGDNLYYLQLTWHTYADRIELLDERNLDRALELILKVR